MIEDAPDMPITRCLQLIEQKLKWGDSADWSNYDFSKLSDEVHQRTQVRLSVTTLKRIWGKVKYESAPTITTLNTLAQFAGYEDWRHFCQDSSTEELKKADMAVHTPEQNTRQSKRVKRFWFMLAIPFVVVGCFFILSARKPGKLNPDDFEFRANKVVAEGVPNSVVFHYDASVAATDSVYIVQTWDIRRKKLVSKDNHEHSAMYYYPGFFKTKLIADDQVVKTHDLFVTSDGWLCLAEQEGRLVDAVDRPVRRHVRPGYRREGHEGVDLMHDLVANPARRDPAWRVSRRGPWSLPWTTSACPLPAAGPHAASDAAATAPAIRRRSSPEDRAGSVLDR